MKPNEIFLNNIDLLVDMAEELSGNLPYEAHVLLKLAQSVRPSGPRIRQLLQEIEPEPQGDWVVAWRHDGLCERLSAILVGYFSAKYLNLDFKFVWPNNSFLQDFFQIGDGNWHDVPDDPCTVLSQAFVEKHLVNENSILHPSGVFSFNRATAKRITIDSYEMVEKQQQFIRPCWLASNRMFADLNSTYSYNDFRDFFVDQLLSVSMREKIQTAWPTTLPRRRIALHIRGGDIIYGNTRFSNGFGRLKSMPIPVAERICEKYAAKGYAVIAFGATISDLNYLADKFPSTVHLLGLNDADISGCSRVLHDVLAMSECKEVISSTDTAVTKLASMLGGASLLSVEKIFSENEEYEILATYVSEPSFKKLHPLQRAFINWSLFVTSPKNSSFQIRLMHVQSAYENDPENTRYCLFAYMLNVILENHEAAELAHKTISVQLGGPPDRFFREGKIEQIGIYVNSGVFLPLLLEIDAMPRRPAGATQIVEALLSKVAPETQKKFGAQGKHFVTKRDIYWHLDKLGCLEFSEIIEIGANSGQDTLVLLNISPSAQIHAFEPDPRAIAAFKMKEFPPRVTLFETAISAISGVTTFYPSDKWGDNAWHQSGSIRNPKNHLEKYPEVTFSEVVILPTSTLDGWSEKYGIGEVDFIWADVQGAELDMIRGGLETLGRTRYLYTEYSNDELYEGQISLEELLTLLPNFRVVADFGGDVLLRNLSRTLG